MPNGGTDNCMNCQHNRANHATLNVKTAPRSTRLSFCSIHAIPMHDEAWTYCSNIYSDKRDKWLPISTIGLHSGGYSRIPWLGRTAPHRVEKIESCAVCGVLQAGSEGLGLRSMSLNIDETFCSNDHYRQWIQSRIHDAGAEKLYDVGRSSAQEDILNNGHFKDSDFSGVAIDHQDDYGWSALHLAAYLGQADSVIKLLELNASPSLSDSIGFKPIDLAGSEGHTNIVKVLLAHSYPDESSREQALLSAATQGNLEIVEALINLGTDIECADYRGRTALYLAVWRDHYTTAVFLLDNGADVLVTDKYNNTPLKIVDTWQTRGKLDLRNLIHKWVEMRKKV